MGLLSFLREPQDENLDAPSTTWRHREIILNKEFLRKVYLSWYERLLDVVPHLPEGRMVEIGSGGGFLKTLDSRILTSDILETGSCDLTFSADAMPFEDDSLTAIMMVDVLHHLPDCRKFFSEAQRVLKPGGKIVMIEPANTPFSRFIYKNFHHESFDPSAQDWQFVSAGPLSGANGALPWILFNRDAGKFAADFPLLECQRIELHTPFAYLLSGGLSFKSFLPGGLFALVESLERLLSPLNGLLAMFQTIVVGKRSKDA